MYVYIEQSGVGTIDATGSRRHTPSCVRSNPESAHFSSFPPCHIRRGQPPTITTIHTHTHDLHTHLHPQVLERERRAVEELSDVHCRCRPFLFPLVILGGGKEGRGEDEGFDLHNLFFFLKERGGVETRGVDGAHTHHGREQQYVQRCHSIAYHPHTGIYLYINTSNVPLVTQTPQSFAAQSPPQGRQRR
jgi:hypothetical protein